MCDHITDTIVSKKVLNKLKTKTYRTPNQSSLSLLYVFSDQVKADVSRNKSDKLLGRATNGEIE